MLKACRWEMMEKQRDSKNVHVYFLPEEKQHDLSGKGCPCGVRFVKEEDSQYGVVIHNRIQ